MNDLRLDASCQGCKCCSVDECDYCPICGGCDCSTNLCTCQPCDVCENERVECNCWEWGEDHCPDCGGSGEKIPLHCCACGGGEYDCICCPRCGAQNIGRCPCPLTVQTHDGTTKVIE